MNWKELKYAKFKFIKYYKQNYQIKNNKLQISLLQESFRKRRNFENLLHSLQILQKIVLILPPVMIAKIYIYFF